MSYIDVNNLKNWNWNSCSGTLPHLIRKLIQASVDFEKIHFPVESGVNTHGYDVILQTSEGNEFVPEGFSVWEIGCSQNPKSKAEDDYNKRKKGPLNVDPKKNTFVFVTSKIFNNKEEWCDEKKEEAFWKDVKVVDANDLECWIESCPAVNAWLLPKLDLPQNIESLDNWWKNWKDAGDYNITFDLVLSGHDEEYNNLKSFLESNKSVILQAPNKEESIAFLAATIQKLPKNQMDWFFSRCIIVKNREDLNQVINSKFNLWVIPFFSNLNNVSELITHNDNSAYIPIDFENKVSNPQIQLKKVSKYQFADGLESLGFNCNKSKVYAIRSAMSITNLKRILSPCNNNPSWVNEMDTNDLIPAFLINSWDETNTKDCKIIESISKKNYDDYLSILMKFKDQNISPLINFNYGYENYWEIINPEEVFKILASKITSKHLINFKNIILKIFKLTDENSEEINKKKGLPVAKDFNSYSYTLKKGVLKTLILISIYGEKYGLNVSEDSENWVDNIISDLLKNQTNDFWKYNAPFLPLFAEASPKEFLNIVEDSLKYEDNNVKCLFNKKPILFFDSCYHIDLLWALENLVWDEKYFTQVVRILFKLTEIDIKANISNTPKETLREIFMLWYPKTCVSSEKRLKVLKSMVKDYPQKGWDLLLDLMPSRDTSFETHEPLYRKIPWGITQKDYYENLDEIVDLTIKNTKNDGNKWISLMKNYSDLTPKQRWSLIESLKKSEITDFKVELWNYLKLLIINLKKYHDFDINNKEEYEELKAIIKKLEPTNLIDKNLWFFDTIPIEFLDKEEYWKKSKITAIKQIKEESGFDGLIELSKKVNRPDILGRYLANEFNECDEIFNYINNKDKKISEFVHEYIFTKGKDTTWIQTKIIKFNSENWSDSKIVDFLIKLPYNNSVWKIVNSFKQEVIDEYWNKCKICIVSEADDIIYFIEKMNQYNRFDNNLLNMIFYHAEEMPSNLIANNLKEYLENNPKEIINEYKICKLFKVLYDKDYDKNELFKLELPFYNTLRDCEKNTYPLLIFQELSNNPSSFITLIKLYFKDYESINDFMAYNLRNIFRDWSLIPGSDENGKIDFDKLNLWVKQVRILSEEEDLLDKCDYKLGELFANDKPNLESWPSHEICQIIEELNSEYENKKLNQGFYIKVKNNRGVVQKNWDEGGEQEKELSKKYEKYSQNIKDEYPVTSRLLNEISKSYNDEAKREDVSYKLKDWKY